jgi:hypothetical protein
VAGEPCAGHGLDKRLAEIREEPVQEEVRYRVVAP